MTFTPGPGSSWFSARFLFVALGGGIVAIIYAVAPLARHITAPMIIALAVLTATWIAYCLFHDRP